MPIISELCLNIPSSPKFLSEITVKLQTPAIYLRPVVSDMITTIHI